MENHYDQFWSETDWEKRDDRSRQRAEGALRLMGSLPPCPLLDVGCGRGVVGEVFLKKGFEVFGVDFSKVALEEAERRGIRTLSGEIGSLDLTRKFPVVLCLEVLEHLPEPLKALEALKGHLDGPGILILSLPNEFHLLRRMAMMVGYFPFQGHHYSHLHLFSPSSAEKFIREGGLQILSSCPISLVPPRFPFPLRVLGDFLAWLSPSLFSISVVYRAVRRASSAPEPS